MFQNQLHIVLASASPQRQTLLDRLDVQYTLCPTSIDETISEDEIPVDYVLRIAKEKAFAAREKCGSDLPILAADTVIVFNQKILGKPKTREDAKHSLEVLSGKLHTVLTAVILLNKAYYGEAISKSKVSFMLLSSGLIDAYLDTGEFQDRAGAYAIQGIGESLIEHIEGSFSGVMGLPLHTVLTLFRAAQLWKLNS